MHIAVAGPAHRGPPLQGDDLVVVVEGELGVEALEHREVRGDLLGQLAHVAPLEFVGPLVLLVEPALRVLDLALDVLEGLRRPPLADGGVFRHVEGRQLVGHPRDRLGIGAAEAHGEGDGRPALLDGVDALQIDPDVAPQTHHALLVFPAGTVKSVLVDDSLEPRAAQGLLADPIHPGLELARERRPGRRVRHLRPGDQDGRGGAVDARHRQRDRQGRRQGRGQDAEPQVLPAGPDRGERGQVHGTTTMSPGWRMTFSSSSATIRL